MQRATSSRLEVKGDAHAHLRIDELDAGLRNAHVNTSGLAFLAWALAGTNAVAADAFSCPRSIGSLTMPGSMFPTSRGWYGSESLAVLLQPDGRWHGLGPRHGFRDKLWWYSTAFEVGMESQLKITGRRLDGQSPPARISRTTNAQGMAGGGLAMLMLVEFPSAGCWQLTGEFKGQQLTFVVETTASVSDPAS